jgi:hypothetical protein
MDEDEEDMRRLRAGQCLSVRSVMALLPHPPRRRSCGAHSGGKRSKPASATRMRMRRGWLS